MIYARKVFLIYFFLCFFVLGSCGSDITVKIHLTWPQDDSSYQYKISDVEMIQISFWQETKEENPFYKLKKVEELNFGKDDQFSAKINKGNYDIYIKGLDKTNSIIYRTELKKYSLGGNKNIEVGMKPSEWKISTIIEGELANLIDASLVLDSKGNPNVIFFCPACQKKAFAGLYYGKLGVSGWEFQLIGEDNYIPDYLYSIKGSLILDKNDYPMIVYCKYPEINGKSYQELTLTSWNGASWESSTIFSKPDIGDGECCRSPVILLNENGNPMVINRCHEYENGYPVVSSLNLNDAYSWNGQSWESFPIFKGNGFSNRDIVDIKRGKNNSLHVLFLASLNDASSNQNFYYGYWDGNEWKINLFPDYSVGCSSLAVSSLGVPNIALSSDKLYFAYPDGITWGKEVVVDDTSEYYGMCPSLVLDSFDQPMIIYENSDNHSILFSALENGKWEYQVIDNEGLIEDIGIHKIDNNISKTIYFRFVGNKDDPNSSNNKSLKYGERIFSK